MFFDWPLSSKTSEIMLSELPLRILCGIYDGDFDKAFKSIDIILKIVPNNTNALNTKASIFIQLARYDKALECIEATLITAPGDSHGLSLKGEIQTKLDRQKEAAEYLGKALELDEYNAHAWTAKGNLLEKLGKLDQAIACYNKAMSLQQEMLDLWKSRHDDMERKNKNLEKDYCYWIEEIIRRQFNENKIRIGSILIVKELYIEALQLFNEILSISRTAKYTYWEALYKKGYILFKLRRLYSSKKFITSALGIDRNNSRRGLNERLTNHQRYEEALECIDGFLVIDPLDSVNWEMKSCLLELIDREEEAKEYYDKAWGIVPSGFNDVDEVLEDRINELLKVLKSKKGNKKKQLAAQNLLDLYQENKESVLIYFDEKMFVKKRNRLYDLFDKALRVVMVFLVESLKKEQNVENILTIIQQCYQFLPDYNSCLRYVCRELGGADLPPCQEKTDVFKRTGSEDVRDRAIDLIDMLLIIEIEKDKEDEMFGKRCPDDRFYRGRYFHRRDIDFHWELTLNKKRLLGDEKEYKSYKDMVQELMWYH